MGIEHNQDFKSLDKTINNPLDLKHHLYNFNLQIVEDVEIIKSCFDDEEVIDDFKDNFSIENVDRLYHIGYIYTTRDDNQEQQQEQQQEHPIQRSKRKRIRDLRYRVTDADGYEEDGEEEEEDGGDDEDYEAPPRKRGRPRKIRIEEEDDEEEEEGRGEGEKEQEEIRKKRERPIRVSQIINGQEAEAVIAKAEAEESVAVARKAKIAAFKAENEAAVKKALAQAAFAASVNIAVADFSTVDVVARLKSNEKFIYFHMNAVFDVQRRSFIACMILITRDHDIFYHSLTTPLRIRKTDCKYAMYNIKKSLLEDGVKIKYADKLAHDLTLKSFFSFHHK